MALQTSAYLSCVPISHTHTESTVLDADAMWNGENEETGIDREGRSELQYMYIVYSILYM